MKVLLLVLAILFCLLEAFGVHVWQGLTLGWLGIACGFASFLPFDGMYINKA